MEKLLEVKAGLLRLQGSTLAPDPRKGVIELCMDEYGLTHFTWCERTAQASAAVPEIDVIIALPGEAVFEQARARQCFVFEPARLRLDLCKLHWLADSRPPCFYSQVSR